MVRPRLSVCFLLVVAAMVLASCGGGGDPGEDQLSSDGGRFTPGVLADLPKPGGALPVDPATFDGGVWTQSFEIDGRTPLESMMFYEAALQPQWAAAVRPAPLAGCKPNEVGATCTYRAAWTRAHQRLEITASPDGADTDLDVVLSSTS